MLADEQEKKEIAGIPVVCEYGDMLEYIRRNVVDEVFVHLSSQTNLPINKIIKELEVMGVTVDLNINVFEMEIRFKERSSGSEIIIPFRSVQRSIRLSRSF